MNKPTTLLAEWRSSDNRSLWQFWQRLLCALFGHHVDNLAFEASQTGARHCRCGEEFLHEDCAVTRIRHNVSCFLFGHRYVMTGERDGHHEYVCFPCGHPLLFEKGRDPYVRRKRFSKKVRYLCNLFGHRVRRVAQRRGLTEYACDCGHSFLKREQHAEVVKHPLTCLFAGHSVRFVERRGSFAEYLCGHCGHTFCFVVNR